MTDAPLELLTLSMPDLVARCNRDPTLMQAVCREEFWIEKYRLDCIPYTPAKREADFSKKLLQIYVDHHIKSQIKSLQ